MPGDRLTSKPTWSNTSGCSASSAFFRFRWRALTCSPPNWERQGRRQGRSQQSGEGPCGSVPAAFIGKATRQTIFFAIEDIFMHRQAERALRASEVRYRRLFETAQDAILILDGDTGKIIDSNPFLSDLLGYSAGELRGKELWEIGLFQDIEAT